MKHTSHLTAFVACLLAGLAAPAVAQEAPDDLKKLLETDVGREREVVTAARRPTKAAVVPATVEVITAEEIENRGYANLEELLHDLPGFDFNRAYGREWSTIFMRGYRSDTSSRFVFMIDGIVENDLWLGNA